MQKQQQLDAAANVVASGLAYFDMGKLLGPNELETLQLTLGGTSLTRAMMTDIQLKANQKTIFQSTGTRLGLSNLYNGQIDDATALILPFLDYLAMTPDSREVGSLDLRPRRGKFRESTITSLRLEIQIAGATAPTLAGLADTSRADRDPDSDMSLLIRRRHSAMQVIGAAGEVALQVPHLDPQGGGSIYNKIYIYCSNLTRLRAIREGNVDFDVTKAQNEVSQRRNGRTPQTGLVVADFVQDRRVRGRAWDTRRNRCNSASLMGTFSAGETIYIETEELLPLSAY